MLLRIFFTLIIAQIMGYPFLKLVGGLLLLWIAVKLIVPSDEHGEDSVKAGDTLWRAVWLVTVADIVMSLDNVIAIAAAAETAAVRVDLAHALTIKTMLIVFGLATSVPLIIAGQRAADEGAGALPDPGLGRRRPARLGRGRDHRQGRRALDRLPGARSQVRQGCISGRPPSARSSWWRSGCGDPAVQAQERAGAAAGRRSARAGGVSAQAASSDWRASRVGDRGGVLDWGR